VESTWDALDTLTPAPQKPSAINTSLNRRAFLYTAASALMGFSAYGLFRHYLDTPVFSRTFISPPGEMIQSRLPDGTLITLDTDTHIEVSYFTQRRETRLLQGQVMFSVAHNADKPFTVDAESTRVTVVGTRFSVRDIDRDVKVAVQEGHVRVETAGTPEVMNLFASDGVIVQAITHTTQQIRVEPKNVGVWQYGRIAFENASMEEAIREFARYGEKRLIASPETSQIRITGNFDITGSDSFVKTLPKVVPIRYEQQGEHICIVPR
jgi:transmembrane sensor